MSEFKVNTITNKDGNHGPQVCGITTFGGSGLQLPSGPTEFRGGRGRGVFGSGNTPSDTRRIDMIEIATQGNATDFGDDTIDGRGEGNASFASATRGVFAGGYSTGDGAVSNISYMIISSNGGVNDFGDLLSARYSNAGASNQIRGLSFAGKPSPSGQSLSAIEFVTISTTGDSNNFGDLTENVFNTAAGVSSPIRAFQFAGLTNLGPVHTNVIHATTIATLGDAVKWGDLTIAPDAHAGSSNSTRGLSWCGQTPSNINDIKYFDLTSEGNGVDFGDASATKDYLGACASHTRGLCGGGQTPTKLNVIEFVTIATTGNAADFGDLTVARRFCAGFSDVHGGLAQ